LIYQIREGLSSFGKDAIAVHFVNFDQTVAMITYEDEAITKKDVSLQCPLGLS
jgi:hypothetical protein